MSVSVCRMSGRRWGGACMWWALRHEGENTDVQTLRTDTRTRVPSGPPMLTTDTEAQTLTPNHETRTQSS